MKNNEIKRGLVYNNEFLDLGWRTNVLARGGFFFFWEGGVRTYLDKRHNTNSLNNFEYISRTVNINSQNKRHFTYITQFTIRVCISFFCLTQVPHVNYSNHDKKRWYNMKDTKHSTKLVLICHFFNSVVSIKSLLMWTKGFFVTRRVFSRKVRVPSDSHRFTSVTYW